MPLTGITLEVALTAEVLLSLVAKCLFLTGLGLMRLRVIRIRVDYMG
jgi:hypothetical protein